MKRKEITRYFFLPLLFVFIATSVNVLQVLAENKQPGAIEDYKGNVKPLDTLKARILAGDAKDDAQKALDKLIEKIADVNKAKKELKKAQDALNKAMAADFEDKRKSLDLEAAREVVAKAEAALREAEAEALEAMQELEEAIAKVEKDEDRKELRRKRDAALSKWWTKSGGAPGQFALRDSLEGVVTVEMKTDSGKPVNLRLPADIRAGDTISGSVDEESLKRSGDTLEGAVLDIGGKKHQLRNGIFTFVMPIAKTTLPIILQARSGREMARKQISVNKIPTQPVNVVPPRIGQTGQIVSISGTFDGNADNTKVTFTPNAQQPAQTNMPVVAQSPRYTHVKIQPNAATGAGTMTIQEKGVPQQFKFNVLNVQLSADRLQLKRGETTPLAAIISGAEGLVEDNHQVILNLKNLSPSVVRFNSTSSDTITTKLTPNNKGTATFNETLTGISAGAFTIHAFLKAGDEPSNPRDWVRRIAKLKRQAANQSGKKENKDALKKNAAELDTYADLAMNWWDDSQTRDKETFKNFLKKEKEDLDEMQKREDKDSEAWKKIGEAKDAVDNAAKAAGVELE